MPKLEIVDAGYVKDGATCTITLKFDADPSSMPSTVLDVLMNISGVAKEGCQVVGKTLSVTGNFPHPRVTYRFVVATLKVQHLLKRRHEPELHELTLVAL